MLTLFGVWGMSSAVTVRPELILEDSIGSNRCFHLSCFPERFYTYLMPAHRSIFQSSEYAAQTLLACLAQPKAWTKQAALGHLRVLNNFHHTFAPFRFASSEFWSPQLLLSCTSTLLSPYPPCASTALKLCFPAPRKARFYFTERLPRRRSRHRR